MWNDTLESSSKQLRRVVSNENMLNFPYWIIPFTFHTDASDTQLGDVISHNNKTLPSYQKI